MEARLAAMKRPGWNPTRRSRTIGTAAQGRDADNRMVVPNKADMLRRLVDPVFLDIDLAGGQQSFVIERTRPNSMYSCTVDDVVDVLECVGQRDLEGLDLVVFRQPTRNQARLNPIWGRLSYFLQLGGRAGAALVLEAVTSPTSITLDRRLVPEDRAGLERPRKDGARLTEGRRRIEILCNSSVCRAVQLYRTVLHEVGHWVDYLDKVERPSNAAGEDWDQLWERYWQRPTRERDDFAHRYADELGASLRAIAKLPFDRRDDPGRMVDLGVRASDSLSPPSSGRHRRRVASTGKVRFADLAILCHSLTGVV